MNISQPPSTYHVFDEENFEISLLIGAYCYWTFVEDHTIRGTGPAAVASKLGYLLSLPLPKHPHNTTISLFLVSVQTPKETSNHERFLSKNQPEHNQPLKIPMISSFSPTSFPTSLVNRMVHTASDSLERRITFHYLSTTMYVIGEHKL